MPEEPDYRIPDAANLKGPARDFALFCVGEIQRRENSGREFDLALHNEAVKLILSKLTGH
jgi:hypothetical protein